MKIGAWSSDSGEVYIVAECGINHQGSVEMADKLITAAADAGANAVKFQWYNTEALKARRGREAEALRPYQLGPRDFQLLQIRAGMKKLDFLCSVFDLESADAYLALDPVAVKIGSGELGEHELIRHVAKAGKPLILSTGMATMRDVGLAWGKTEPCDVALLHCVSAYPAPLEQVNLRAMDALKAFHCPVGWSDHTDGFWAAELAVARGACIIEKHLTLDRNLPGPDHQASMTPQDFAYMVKRLRGVTVMLGSGEKVPQACEAATMKACGR